MRYITGSRMFRLGDAMSILARSVRAPSGNSPSRMRSNKSRFSSTERLRYGLSFPGSVSVPRVLAHFLGRQIAHVRLARLDQLHRPFMDLRKIIRRVEQPVFPIAAQPMHVADDRFDIFRLFLRRVGIVEAQIAFAAEFLGQSEINADGFGVADMQIAVRLRRETGMHPPSILVGLQIFKNNVPEEI